MTESRYGPTGPHVPPAKQQPSFDSNWYADPTGRHRLRFYDGARWTDHVSDGHRTGLDPVHAAGPRASTPARSTAEPRRRIGCLTALLAILAALVTLAVIVVGTFLALGLTLQDDPPGWLRVVALGASTAVLFAVLRAGRKPPG